MHWLDSKVTVYDNVYSTEGSETTIGNFLRLGLRHKADIDRYRHTKDKGIKLGLPCATVSGTFEGRRAASNLSSHSGLVAIDIDKKDNPHLETSELKEMLSKILQVAYVGRSVGGEGVWCIILLAYPERHREQFNAIRRDFQSHGIEIDTACKDVSRLRVCSYDTEHFIRENPKPYKGLLSEKRPAYHSSRDNASESKLWAIAISDAAVSSKVDMVSGYKDWRDMAFALSRELGEDGREFFHIISSVNESQYNQCKCDRQYDACLKHSHISDGITFGTFIYQAEVTLPLEEWEKVKMRVHDMIGRSAFNDVDVSPAASEKTAPAALVEVTPAASEKTAPAALVEVTPAASEKIAPAASVEVTPAASEKIAPAASVEVNYDELNEPMRESPEYIQWLFGIGKYAAIASRPRYFSGFNLE